MKFTLGKLIAVVVGIAMVLGVLRKPLALIDAHSFLHGFVALLYPLSYCFGIPWFDHSTHMDYEGSAITGCLLGMIPCLLLYLLLFSIAYGLLNWLWHGRKLPE